MKKESKILGPTGIKIRDYLTGEMKPVGGRIPEEEFGEWETYKKQCNRSGLKVSDEGLLDMIKTHNKITLALYPMAHEMGYKAVDFKNIMVDVFLDVISNINDEKWKKDSEKLRKEIIHGFEDSLSIKLSK